MIKRKLTISILLLLNCWAGWTQELNKETLAQIEQQVDHFVQQEISVGKVRIDTLYTENKSLHIHFNANLSYYPLRKESVKKIHQLVTASLPQEKNIKLYTQKHLLEDLIPKAHQGNKKNKNTFFYEEEKPLVQNLTKTVHPTQGLQNKHIALWQSHGYYYEPKLSRWEWQRARIFQTVEDLYTQSYVLPFLVPMLEAAGANVLLPRERDTQLHEVIVDNDPAYEDNGSVYIEQNGKENWTTGDDCGFAATKRYYTDNENPFKQGSFRQVASIKKGTPSLAEWIPSLPEAGEYALYVSYQTVENSTNNAIYTVHHQGRTTKFSVNQQMGGGTWIYLGTFFFEKGMNPNTKITLSNQTGKRGEVVTADAIKIGGGYGNIARTVSQQGTSANTKSSEREQAQESQNESISYPYETSGYPRFTEAARYWLQWAGLPDSIYTPSQGVNDYTDDYQCRGRWVNYLAGGTQANPNEKGLNIPVDLAFAFHTDAGTTFNDSIIGTLAIFRTDSYDGVYANGVSRYAARELADLIQSQLVNDIRTLYHPQWTRRGMWDKAYSEASTPRVPTMLLELLSHQNFADMRYGLDPRFRFTVSRAIYKGILKYISSQYNTNYVVQPLPVDEFRAELTPAGKVQLQWNEVIDPLEPTAVPTQYIVYQRIGNGSFDQGTLVSNKKIELDLPSGVVMSYKVTAVNPGGESFPSEILSVGKSLTHAEQVLVVNGFTRLSAPDDFDAQADSIAGFLDDFDHGVPYLKDISYIGKMKEFRRTTPWMDDDSSGFGDSYANYETNVIAGNQFDYPALHGEAILKAGYSFASCSKKAVEEGKVDLNAYQAVDLILGKEKQTKMGEGKHTPLRYKTFTTALQKQISAYTAQGGHLFVSGAYVASDICDNPLAPKCKEEEKFLADVLHIQWRADRAATQGKLKEVFSPYFKTTATYPFNQSFDANYYRVESPDAIEPAHKGAYTTMRYSENNLSAAVAYKGKNRTYVLGVPFETITSREARNSLMNQVLTFFFQKD